MSLTTSKMHLKLGTETLLVKQWVSIFKVLQGLIRSYQILLGLIRSYCVLLGPIRSYQVLIGSNRSYEVLLGLIRSYQVLLGLIRSYQVLLGPFMSYQVLLCHIRSYEFIFDLVRSPKKQTLLVKQWGSILNFFFKCYPFLYAFNRLLVVVCKAPSDYTVPVLPDYKQVYNHRGFLLIFPYLYQS